LFVRAVRESVHVETLTAPILSTEVSDAVRFIESFRQHGRGHVPIPGEADAQEAIALARRTSTFFQEASKAPLALQPYFPGCGWLSECYGDVLSSNVLYEIKSGARAFRMLDVKQLLVYCALNFSAKSYDILDVCLVNPREGVYFSESLDAICELLSGRSAVEVLGDIVEYVSDPVGEYRAG
jgi:hypothetical protein